MSRILRLFLLLAIAFACSDKPDSSVKIIDDSMVAVDLLQRGPHTFSEYEYAVEAAPDREVLPFQPDRKIDIRGRLYMPLSDKAIPLIVFLHGNHATCGRPSPDGYRVDSSNDFTERGHCPLGYIEAPSYRGYDLSARHLASQGYAVISINANRGINGAMGPANDSGLVHARGALILRHIEAFQKWSQMEEVPSITNHSVDLRGRIDFSQIGLVGHSRGGEGARYAFNILENSLQSANWKTRMPVAKIRALFEIGPMDMGAGIDPTLPRVDANGIPWNVLIPGCDRDMIDYDGVHVFERMLGVADGRDKTVFTIWGANHNYFNSEWHMSDARNGCSGTQNPLWDTTQPRVRGSNAQQMILASLLSAFFRAHVGSERKPELARIFDPQYRLPATLSALAESSREIAPKGLYLLAPNFQKGTTVRPLNEYLQDDLELIQKYWDKIAKERGFKAIKASLENNPFLRPASVLQLPASATPSVVDVAFQSSASPAQWRYLDLSLAFKVACAPWPEDPCAHAAMPSAELQLLLADGSLSSAVMLDDYVQLHNWNDSFFRQVAYLPNGDGTASVSYRYQPVLYQSARMELRDFNLPSGEIAGLRFRFPSGRPITLVIGASNLSN